MSGNNNSVRNQHLQHALVYVAFNNFIKLIVNVIIGVDSVKEYLIRTCIKAETCREDADRFVLLLQLMIRGRRLSRGSIPCRKKVAADENADDHIKGINKHIETENSHTSKPLRMKGKRL